MLKKSGLLWVGVLAAAALVLSFMSGPVSAAWPEKPVNLYIGWSAGGSSDIVSRGVALEMEKKLKTKILATNVTGALGSIGASQVASAPADGYLWFGGTAVHGTWPVLGHADISWDDFYAFLAVVFPTTIYVKADAPWKNLDEFLADVKSKPKGTFKFGHPGAGSNGAIFGGVLMEAAGITEKVVSVPYKGGREAGKYLLSGDINFTSVTMGDLSDWAVAGRIRPIANLYEEDVDFEGVTFPSAVKKFPSLEPYQAINPYFGVYVPRDVNASAIEKISEAFLWAVQQPGFKKLAVEQRAGVMAPKIGIESDKQMSKIEAARGTALWDLQIAKNDPKKLGIPEPANWNWPPHERAAKVKPWPDSVEKMFNECVIK
jgi:tripartite-type tricarboxylate transporter receptor subunit TctC